MSFLVPETSLRVQSSLEAIKPAQADKVGFCDRRFYTVVHLADAVIWAVGNIFAYPGAGIYGFVQGIYRGQFSQAFTSLGGGLWDGARSAIFVVAGLICMVVSLAFPSVAKVFMKKELLAKPPTCDGGSHTLRRLDPKIGYPQEKISQGCLISSEFEEEALVPGMEWEDEVDEEEALVPGLTEVRVTPLRSLPDNPSEGKKYVYVMRQYRAVMGDALPAFPETREGYKEFVQWLDRHPEQKELAYLRWTSVVMTPYFRDLVLPVTGCEEVLWKDVPGTMRRWNEELKHAPFSTKKWPHELAWQQFRGALGNANFSGNENIPRVLARQQYGDFETVYLGHPSPTAGADWTGIGVGMAYRAFGVAAGNGDAVAPNYEAFLRVAKDKGEPVLYVIHQRNDEREVVEYENGRTEAILGLQDRHSNFHAIVQLLEGEFFEENRGTFTKVKEEFPEKSDLWDQVRDVFFDGKDEIKDDEWQTAVLFFYIFEKIDLKMRLRPRYYVTACKEMLDRGGMMALVELMVHAVWTGQEHDSKLLEQIMVSILGAPFAVKRKEMVPHRLEPGLRAIQFLIDHPEACERLRKLTIRGGRPTRVTIPEMVEEREEPVGLLEGIERKEEFFDVLRSCSGGSNVICLDAKVPPSRGSIEQCNKDFPRIGATRYTYNGKVQAQEAKAEELYQEIVGEVGEEIAAEAIAYFHQGIFADVQMAIIQALGIMRSDRIFIMDWKQPIDGDVPRQHTLDVQSKSVAVTGSHHFLLYTIENGKIEDRLAIIQASVKVNIARKEMYIAWSVKKVLDHADGELAEEQGRPGEQAEAC